MISFPEPPKDGRSLVRRFVDGVSHPIEYVRGIAGGAPVYPLMILFGLNVVDEFDRMAFAVLLPNIRDYFGLDLQGILNVVTAMLVPTILLQIPIAFYADRAKRIPLALTGAMMFAFFSVGTGLAFSLWFLVVARLGSGLGKAVADPVHNSLLADYYPVEQRPRVYSFHRAANSVGQMLGPLLAGIIATYLGWRTPFFLFAIPTVVLVVLALRLREPIRGAQERRLMNVSEEVVETEEPPPSFEEAWRIVYNVRTLRRIYSALPFLAPALFGYLSLAVFKYEALGLNEAERGLVTAISEPFQLVGLYIGARVGTRLFRRDPSLILRFISVVAFVAAAMAALFAIAPTVWIALLASIVTSVSFAIVAPGVFATLSLALPPRTRSVGFALASLWVLPGIALGFPFIAWLANSLSITAGMLVLTPAFFIAGLIIASAARFVDQDIKNVWRSTAARSEALYERRQGKSKMLIVRNLDVSYGDVQVLFGVDFEIDGGEIVALLGTNGAGKSTLLKSISGVVEAHNGAVVFDGRDVTHAPPHEISSLGISQVPGGQGVFPSLTVAENLRVAGWIERKRARRGEDVDLAAQLEQVLDIFPILRERLEDPAANLSGGQQQMLALAMAFLARPKLLMIDELSLGLAPVVVEQLLDVVRAIRDQGTTIILVEQSVNVALTLAETAYFMEKGEIRFHGSTAELLERPDVLRSVFLEGAQKGMATASAGPGAPAAEPAGGNGAGATGTPPAAPAAPAARAAATASAMSATPVAPATPADGAAAGRQAASVPVDDGPAALAVDGLSVRFGGIRAVDDVTLSVAPGEIVGIIGPNGAGKTTLFDLISGFTAADGGRVLLGGRDISGLSPDGRARRGLGRSFQDARLFPALTVEETIAVSLERWIDVKDPFNAVLRLPAQQDSEHDVRTRVDELIDLMGIESFRSKFVRELSTGSRRVVDLACVLAHRPSVVLLDEPSSGIAQRETEALGPLMRRIRENLGASLLVIEHDMPLVTSVADRLVALDQGHVVTVGTTDEVLNHPEVVASYLGNTDAVIARSGARGD